MNSETNSLGYENNIQTIPESHSFPENKYKHEIPIIYHSESDKIIDQSCEARLLNDTPNKKSCTHKIFVIRKCKPEHIGDIFLRPSENDYSSIILDINIHTPLGEKIKTGLFRKLSFFLFEKYKTLRVETHILIDHHKIINSLILSGYTFEGITQKFNVNSELEEFAVFSLLKDQTNTGKSLLFPAVDSNIYRDEKIALRLAKTKDTFCIWLEQSNPESSKWGLFETASLDEIKQKARRCGLNSAVGPNILLTIIECSTGNAVGKIVIRNVVPPHVGDVGYGILPEYRGLGYAVRALNLLKKWAFNEAGYVRLELGVKEGNIASERVAQKGGFEFEGMRPGRLKNHDGSYSNEMHYFFLNPNISYRKIED
ncbi:GNAT family N-acetyltransferase [Klebsiella variicola]|uniref:GNAT family N-acetyltransferase n=1 Tax=Klebsiella variicola TaxID=244366 RepID=UPI00349F3BCF